MNSPGSDGGDGAGGKAHRSRRESLKHMLHIGGSKHGGHGRRSRTNSDASEIQPAPPSPSGGGLRGMLGRKTSAAKDTSPNEAKEPSTRAAVTEAIQQSIAAGGAPKTEALARPAAGGGGGGGTAPRSGAAPGLQTIPGSFSLRSPLAQIDRGTAATPAAGVTPPPPLQRSKDADGASSKAVVPAGSTAAAAAPEQPLLQRSAPPKGAAVIAIAGVAAADDAALHMLRQRGFVVHVAVRRTAATLDVAVGLGPKLAHRLAIEENVPTRGELDRGQRIKLAVAAMHVLGRIPGFAFAECFLLHEKEALERLRKHHTPDDIADYFGTGVSMYFTFLQFYTKFLLGPAVAGVVLFLGMLWKGYSIKLIPLFCIGIALWSTLFMEFWKRHAAAASYRWGSHGAENEEDLQDLAKNAGGVGRAPTSRIMVSLPAILFAIAFCLHAMLYCIRLSDSAEDRYGKDSYWKYWPMVVYSVVPLACSFVYGLVAVKLNQFEGHRTERQRSDALTLKLFGFQFINFFCALFYIGFYLRDMERLSGMLFTLCVTKQITGNIMEAGMPIAKRKFKVWNDARLKRAAAKAKDTKKAAKEAADKAKEAATGGAVPQLPAPDAQAPGALTSPAQPGAQPALPAPQGTAAAAAAGPGAAAAPAAEEVEPPPLGPLLLNEGVLPLAEFEAQLAAEPFVLSDQLLEIVVQFGFSTMFAVAFPLAPLFAYLNNLGEYRVDVENMLQAKRPTPMVVSGIGSWYMCLEAMGYLATLTNCCLMVLMGDSLTGLVPASMSSLLERTEGKIILALVLEHVLLAVKFAVGEFVDDEPMWVKEAVAKEQIEQQRATRELRLTAHKMQLPEKKLAAAAADPEEDLNEDAVDDSTNSFEKAPKSTIWKFSPLWYAPLICVPYVIGAFGLSGAWVIPLAAMLIGYMKRRKDTSDLGMAIGVVSDAQLLKLITKELPFWFYGTDVERVEWMNKLLQQMWPHATGAAIVIVKTIVEPMLEEYKPPGVTTLKFQKVFLGTFAPRVIGVRTINTSSNTATLEMEVKWAGDPKFVVEVGRAMMPLTVTLSKIRFSGKLRAELSPLMPKIPCFGALAVTFMERPFIDFTFKVGSLDVMSIGPGDMSVAAAVSAIIKSTIQSMMLYPKKLVIPMVDGVDVGPLENPSPKGVLQLHIIGANKLKKADIVGKSDPYVVVKLGEEEVKTKVMNNTLDPRWDKQFDLLVHDKSVQVLTFAVFDEDVGDDELLGTCEIHLSALADDFPTALNVPLSDTTTGSLIMKLHYVPLRPAGMPDTEDVDEEDLDFDEPLFGYDEAGEESDGDGDAATVADSVAGAAGADGGERDALLQRSKPGKLSPAKVAKKSGKKIKGAFKAIKGAVHLSHGPDSPDSKKAAAAAEQAAASAQGTGGSGAAAAPRQSSLAAPADIDASMGVLTLMNVQVKGAKPAKYYCKIRVGDFKRATAPAPKGGDAAWPLIFHTLVKQSKSASILVKVYADAALLGDDLYGTVTVTIADIIAGGCDVQQDWPIQGGRTQGAVSFRAMWSAAVTQH